MGAIISRFAPRQPATFSSATVSMRSESGAKPGCGSECETWLAALFLYDVGLRPLVHDCLACFTAAAAPGPTRRTGRWRLTTRWSCDQIECDLRPKSGARRL